MARRSLVSRFVLLGVATGLTLAAAEAGFRWLGPDLRPYGPGAFYTPNGLVVPVAEIANFLSGGGFTEVRERTPPCSEGVPGLRVKQGYDRPRWDYFDAQGCILIEHNSLGFRDDEFPVHKPPGEFRAIALGDSFTWGCGVLLEHTWPQVVERHLREGGKPAQVINGGFAAGFTPARFDRWMHDHGSLLQPDLVVVGLCLNDLGNGNDVPMLGYLPARPEGHASRIVDYVAWSLDQRAARRVVKDFAAVVKAHPETWNATQNGLRGLKKVLDAKNIPLVVAVLPMLSQLDLEPYPYAGLCAMARDFCRENGILCVDLQAQFLGKDEMDLWVHPTDQHPNHVGQRLIGDAVFAFLREQGLTPK